jgi:hypothetical protein
MKSPIGYLFDETQFVLDVYGCGNNFTTGRHFSIMLAVVLVFAMYSVLVMLYVEQVTICTVRSTESHTKRDYAGTLSAAARFRTSW